MNARTLVFWQPWPASIVQVAEQPSLAVVLPSSQASEEALMPSPHVTAQTDGLPVQPWPGSIAQVAAQPSPLAVLPSSHSSPLSSIALPHTLAVTQTSVFGLQVPLSQTPEALQGWPFAHRQRGEQASPLVVLPSSHVSPALMTPLPQVLKQTLPGGGQL